MSDRDTLARAFREDLMELAKKIDQMTREAGMDSRTSSWIVCDECMHLSAYMAAHAGKVSDEEFAKECLSKLKWHRDHPPPGIRPPASSLN